MTDTKQPHGLVRSMLERRPISRAGNDNEIVWRTFGRLGRLRRNGEQWLIGTAYVLTSAATLPLCNSKQPVSMHDVRD